MKLPKDMVLRVRRLTELNVRAKGRFRNTDYDWRDDYFTMRDVMPCMDCALRGRKHRVRAWSVGGAWYRRCCGVSV